MTSYDTAQTRADLTIEVYTTPARTFVGATPPQAPDDEPTWSPTSATLTQFTITGQATGYWRATFSNPPINLIDPDTILELQQLIGPDFLS